VSTVAPPTGTGVLGLLQTSVKRAFRVRIDPAEVLVDERAALAAATPPVLDETHQAFLAWRRSLLLLVAVGLVPVTTLRLVENFAGDSDALPGALKAILGVSAAIEVGFTLLCFALLGSWTRWRRQRRLLGWSWAIYFLAPFLTFLYPFRSAFEGAGTGPEGVLVGALFGVSAILSLAPKAISLMPGLVRASIATKLLFPGSGAPGWLVVLAAPIYAVLFYVILLVPYQISGSGFFIAGTLCVMAGQAWLGAAGYRLAQPMTQADALARVARARVGYLVATLVGLACLVVGLANLVEALDLEVLTVVNFVLGFGVNLLLLTLVGADFVILALERARGLSQGTAALHAEFQDQIATFAGSGER
jgi:hypothetical protein